jgi:hypothetical protein
MHPVEIVRLQFKAAAGEAAGVELSMRMLADKAATVVTCYEKLRSSVMPARSKRMRPKTAKERMSARRKRLRAQGLRPVQHWVPDLRDPRVRADLLRQGRLLAQHPENAEIDVWIEANYDWGEWR